MADDRGSYKFADAAGRSSPGPHDDPSVWAPRLARILDTQLELYTRLDALGPEQRRCIDEQAPERLLDVLARRQSIIEEIQAANELIEPFSRDWSRLAPALSESQRAALRERFDRVAALVEAICRRDDDDRRALELERARVGSELGTVARARGAVNAYGKPGESGPRFQDRSA